MTTTANPDLPVDVVNLDKLLRVFGIPLEILNFLLPKSADNLSACALLNRSLKRLGFIHGAIINVEPAS